MQGRTGEVCESGQRVVRRRKSEAPERVVSGLRRVKGDAVQRPGAVDAHFLQIVRAL